MSAFGIGIGDKVPDFPDEGEIKLGVLSNMFKGPCNPLGTDKPPVTPFALQLINADNREQYLAHLLAQGWYPLDPDKFARPGALLDMRLTKVQCPFYFHKAVKLQVKVGFEEFFAPIDEILNRPPDKFYDFVWPRGQTETPDYSVTSNPPNFHVAGGSGPWTATFRIKVEPLGTGGMFLPDPKNPCATQLHFFGHLVSTGYDFLAAGTVDEEVIIPCELFTASVTGAPFGWTGVGPFNLPDLPPVVGTVHGLTVSIFFAGYQDT